MGAAAIVTKNQDFCADCHNDLQQSNKKARILNTSNFGSDHPEFRPTIIADAGEDRWTRMILDPKNWPKEHSNIKFNHKKHLDPKGIRNPEKAARDILSCGSCHERESSGRDMQPVNMQKHCAECHRLQFDAIKPDRRVPHGSVELTIKTLEDFYGAFALAGGANSQELPESIRRRPGMAISEPQRLAALKWAQQKTSEAADYVFGKSVCRTCHVISKSAGGSGPQWAVQPVKITRLWMPKAHFDHKSHETTTCVSCHNAPPSMDSSDVLLPQVATCQACHGGEKAAARVPSTCVMCHDFHLPSMTVMRPNLIKASAPKKHP